MDNFDKFIYYTMDNPRWSSGRQKGKPRKKKKREAVFRINVSAIFSTPAGANNNEAVYSNLPVLPVEADMRNNPGASISCSTASEKDESNSLPKIDGAEVISQIQSTQEQADDQQQPEPHEEHHDRKGDSVSEYLWCEEVTDPALWKKTHAVT